MVLFRYSTFHFVFVVAAFIVSFLSFVAAYRIGKVSNAYFMMNSIRTFVIESLDAKQYYQ